MKTNEMNLTEKLMKLKSKVPYIKKEKKQYMKFSVVSSENVLTEFNSHMNTLNLLLFTEIQSQSITPMEIGISEKTGKKIYNYLVDLKLIYTWVNGDNPSEKEDLRFSAFANDENASYALGQALTYAEKTFFMKEFNIPTDDMDPDAFLQEISKRTPITEEHKESIQVQMNKLEEMTEQSAEAFLDQAKMQNSVAAGKNIDKFNEHDFGLVMNTLTAWVNGYEKKMAKKEREAKHAKK